MSKRKTSEVTYRTSAYIGPSIEGVVKHGETFTGRLPERLEQAVRKEPQIIELIVPIEQQAEAEKQINKKNGAYYAFFLYVEKIRKELRYGI